MGGGGGQIIPPFQLVSLTKSYLQDLSNLAIMLPISHFVINVNYMNGITLSLLKMEIIIYYVMDVLSFSRI